jgi:hypothetical protein
MLLPSCGICNAAPYEYPKSTDDVEVGTWRDCSFAPAGFSLIVLTLSKSADLGLFRPKSSEFKRPEPLRSIFPSCYRD